jgi:hypothetical protein
MIPWTTNSSSPTMTRCRLRSIAQSPGELQWRLELLSTLERMRVTAEVSTSSILQNQRKIQRVLDALTPMELAKIINRQIDEKRLTLSGSGRPTPSSNHGELRVRVAFAADVCVGGEAAHTLLPVDRVGVGRADACTQAVNTESCDMIRQPNDDAVCDGAAGQLLLRRNAERPATNVVRAA